MGLDRNQYKTSSLSVESDVVLVVFYSSPLNRIEIGPRFNFIFRLAIMDKIDQMDLIMFI